jgi:hypothetical protein
MSQETLSHTSKPEELSNEVSTTKCGECKQGYRIAESLMYV